MSSVYNEINIKIIVVGLGNVGKSSLVNQCIGNQPSERYMPTIGSNIQKKEYKITEENYLLTISLWDLGGQRSFNPLNPVVFTNTDIAYLTFDLTRPEETIKELETYYLPKIIELSEDTLFFLVGNKLDKIENPKEVLKLIKGKLKEIPIVLTSALTGENVLDLLDISIFNYLGEIEEFFPHQDIPTLDHPFLKSIKKDKNELKKVLINLDDINTLKIQKKPSLSIKKKTIRDSKEDYQKLTQIRNDLRNIENIKAQLSESFYNNLSEIENLIKKLNLTPIQSLSNSIDSTLNQLKFFKDDFELKLEAMLNINSILNKNNPSTNDDTNLDTEVLQDNG